MLRVRVSDRLKPKLAARAAESGFENIETYVQALLRADAGQDDIVSDRDLERLVASRLNNGPGVEFTPKFAREFRQEVAKRRRARNSQA
jgi:hypothetical protein